MDVTQVVVEHREDLVIVSHAAGWRVYRWTDWGVFLVDDVVVEEFELAD